MSGGNDDRRMLDELIASAAADEPSEEQLRRLELRVSPLFTAGSAGAAAGAKVGTSALTKWLAGGVLVGALAAGGYGVHRSMRSSPSAIHVDAAVPDVAALPDAAITDAGTEVDAAVTEAPATISPTPTREKPATAIGADALAEEGRILARAQTALRDGRVARALREIERHQAKFPRGALAEERERLAIEVLLALGRRDDAEARARNFRTMFPDSLQWSRVRALLDSGN